MHQGTITVGLDVGSRTAKGVLLRGEEILTAITPTGLYMQEMADGLLHELLEKAGLERWQVAYIVGTGYGRISLKFEGILHQVVTEISCHALGAHTLHPKTRTILDIGGQDSKAIRVDPATGKVVDFVINDKCAAGTGKFLEMIAASLDLQIEELGEAALRATVPSQITSQCVVFAESEVISLKARGERREEIAAGTHLAVARRVGNLLNRVGIEPDVVFTGGVSLNRGMRAALESHLGVPFADLPLDATYAGALGAAVFARQFAASGQASASAGEGSGGTVDLLELENRIGRLQQRVIAAAHQGPQKAVGYFCLYTPLELMRAAGLTPLRLFKGGDDAVAISGERYTRAYFCQFSQSCVGRFRERDPLYMAIDKLYIFNTCDQVKKAAEAIHELYLPTQIFCLPRERHREAAKTFYRQELEAFQKDLEELAGHKIPPGAISEQIVLHNRVCRLLRQLSELRLRPDPPLTGREFLDLARAYFYLPPEELLPYYQEVYRGLSAAGNGAGPRRVRLMMAGGIVADGDRRLLRLLEEEAGARVVVEDHCTGLRPFCCDVSEEGDPLQALAEGYLGRAPCARMKPIEERVLLAGELARRYQVDGVLYTFLKFCNAYGMGKKLFLDHFHDLGLPVIELPTDYSQSDLGQLKTRVEAFMEVLRPET